jgi:hypothetical protein
MKKASLFSASIYVCLGLFLAGCGGNKGVVTAPSAAITVSTKVVAPTGSGSRAAGRVAEAVVTGASVVLKLADGRSFTMTDNGNGNYSAEITNIGDSFVIEARKGDLLLENMFTNLSTLITGSSFYAGETNGLTTAYTEIARSVVNAVADQLSISGLDVNNNLDLLENLDNAQLNIDYLELRSDIVDGGETQYSELITAISEQLTEWDVNGTPPSDEDNILNKYIITDEYATLFNTAYQPVEIPTGDNDVDSIRTLVNTIITAIFAKDAETLLSAMSSGYLNEGYSNTKEIMYWQTDEWPNLLNCTFNIPSILIELGADGTTAVATALTESTCDPLEFETPIPGIKHNTKVRMLFDMIKENDAWKWNGNQAKAGVEFGTMANNSDSVVSYSIEAIVTEAADYPISDVTVSGPGFSSPMTLLKETGENEWKWEGAEQWIPVSAKPSVGDTYTFSVTFTGDTTPTTYTRSVRSELDDSHFITLTSPVDGNLVSSNSSVTLAWNDITAGVSEVGNITSTFCGGTECSFMINRFGIPTTTTSISVPTMGLTAGTPIAGSICYIDYGGDVENVTCTQLSLTYTDGN